MKPTITVNQYPIGWEWLDRVPLEDFNWLIEIFAILTDYTLYLSDPQAQYNKLLRTQQKLKNKKK